MQRNDAGATLLEREQPELLSPAGRYATKQGGPMYILRIEHPISDFDGWKKAFDSDPVGREKSGVRRYRILRPMDDRKYVMIDLEFDTATNAEALLASMRTIWGRVQGTIITDPKARIVEEVETKDFGPRGPFT